MNKITAKIARRIEQQGIKPFPKWYFTLTNGLIWSAAIISSGIGTGAIALIAYNISSKDWDLYKQLGDSHLGYIFTSLPYLWIILMTFALLISVFDIKHSKSGYRLSPFKLATITIFIPVFLGLIIFASGGGQKIDDYLGKTIASYQTVNSAKEYTWNQPEKGLFSGTIVQIEGNSLIVKNDSGVIRKVDITQAQIKGRAQINLDNKIKIIGTLNNDTFQAREIRPWSNGGNGQYGHGRSQK